MQFIQGTNAQHKGYLHHLQNPFLDGDDNYPTTMCEAYNIPCRREEDNPQHVNENDGVSFAQTRQQKDLLNIDSYMLVFGVFECNYSWAHECQHNCKCTSPQNSCIMTVSPLLVSIHKGQVVPHEWYHLMGVTHGQHCQ